MNDIDMVDMNDMWLQMRCEWYVSDMRAILLIWLIFFVNDIDDWDVNNIDANIAIVSTIIWYDWYNRI